MAGKINDVPLLELYKIARNSVEHFDRILGTFRQIIFPLNGAIITAGFVYITHTKTHGIDYKLIFVGSCLFAIINILVWQLEKHYHRYLIVSSKIAEKIENELLKDGNKDIFANNMLYALTYQFREAKHKGNEDDRIPMWVRHGLHKISKYIRTYDCLYFFPVIGAICLNLFSSVQIKDRWFWIAFFVSSSIFGITSFVIIRYSYWFSKRYRGNKYFEDLSKSIWDGEVWIRKRKQRR